MATQPTDPIVRVAENDTTLPSTGLSNKLLPPTSVLTVGYDANEIVPAEDLNYILDNFGKWLQYFKEELVNREIPIGGIFEITGNSANPSTYFGYGTWSSFGTGQTLVGAGTFTDINGDQIIWDDGDQAGEYNHIMTEAELPNHAHDYSGTTEDDTHNHTYSFSLYPEDGIEINKPASGVGAVETTFTGTTEDDTHNHTYSGTTESTGGGSPMNNIQPSIAVYRWVRTA